MSLYRVSMCPKCGFLQMTTSLKIVKCMRPRCGKSYNINSRMVIKKGPFDTPSEASTLIQAWKAMKAERYEEYQAMLKEEYEAQERAYQMRELEKDNEQAKAREKSHEKSVAKAEEKQKAREGKISRPNKEIRFTTYMKTLGSDPFEFSDLPFPKDDAEVMMKLFERRIQEGDILEPRPGVFQVIN